jgi:hypothetical protein
MFFCTCGFGCARTTAPSAASAAASAERRAMVGSVGLACLASRGVLVPRRQAALDSEDGEQGVIPPFGNQVRRMGGRARRTRCPLSFALGIQTKIARAFAKGCSSRSKFRMCGGGRESRAEDARVTFDGSRNKVPNHCMTKRDSHDLQDLHLTIRYTFAKGHHAYNKCWLCEDGEGDQRHVGVIRCSIKDRPTRAFLSSIQRRYRYCGLPSTQKQEQTIWVVDCEVYP